MDDKNGVVYGRLMHIVYDTRKDLTYEGLHDLFRAVGWSDGTNLCSCKTKELRYRKGQ